MDDRSLDAIGDELRRDAVRRSASVGPLAAMAHLLRRIIQLVQDLLALVAELPLRSLSSSTPACAGPTASVGGTSPLAPAIRRDLDDFYDRP